MTYLNWTWASSDCKVPSTSKIIMYAYSLLKELMYKHDTECITQISCGGFEVVYYENNDIKLRFVLTDWDENLNDYEV